MSLFELLEKIVAAEGAEVEIKLPEENVNHLTLKILKREAERRGKKLELKPSGPRSKRLIAFLEEGVEPEPVRIIRRGRFGIPRLHLDIGAIRRIGLIPFLLFGILLLLGGGAYWALNFLPRAEVILTLKPIPMVKELPVSASTEATEVDVEKGIIPGTEIAVEEEGQKSTPATGTATVGEKAQISLKIKNCGTPPPGGIHVSKGVKLIATTDNSLAFLLDNAVGVDGYSGSGPCPEAEGTATAEKIGEDYNEPTLFSISGFGFPPHSAERVSLTKSGSSKQVTVVASADQAKVRDELKKELVEKGKASLLEQAGSDQVVVQKAIKQEVVEENFAQKVGEQADKVSLTLKMKFTTISYKEEDLQEFISQDLSERIPENYELFPGEMEIEVLEPKLGEKALSLSAKVTAQVIPKLDLEAIKNELAGRDAASAQEYLSSLSNVSAYELRLWPNLPENLRRIPRSTERIRIELQTEAEEEL